MRVSFDLDGTAWKYRTFFKSLAWALKMSGHQVGILTAHDSALREADHRLWRARGFPEPDFLFNHDDMRAVLPDIEGVRNLKIAFCKQVKIDCHIDDFDNRHPGEIEMVLINQADESQS